MVRMRKDGTTATTRSIPWYSRTDLSCPRCYAVFRLDETDFGHLGPFVGLALDQMKWVKLDSAYQPIPDTAFWPDAVSGYCFDCGYMPLVINAPDFGAVHPAAGPTNTPGVLQGLAAAGVAVTFFLTAAGALVGLFLAASGAPYLPDDAQGTAQAVVRAVGAINPSYRYPLATPARPVSPAEARALDADLCALLEGAGLALR